MSKLFVDEIQPKTTGGAVGITGHVLQVKQGGRTSRVTVGVTTFTDVGVFATITPKSTSSKILIMLTGVMGNDNASNQTALKLFRNSTEIGSGTGASGGASKNTFMSMLQEANSGYHFDGFGQNFLDEPSTTSEITYKIQMAGLNGTAVLGGRGDNADIAVPTRLILMEIGG